MIFFRFRQIFIEKNARISKKCCTFALAFRASGCSAVGSALRSGRRGRAFESPHPDKRRNTEVIVFRLFLFIRCCFPSCVFVGQSEKPVAILPLVFRGQSEKPVAILAPVFSTMHTIWTV